VPTDLNGAQTKAAETAKAPPPPNWVLLTSPSYTLVWDVSIFTTIIVTMSN